MFSCPASSTLTSVCGKRYFNEHSWPSVTTESGFWFMNINRNRYFGIAIIAHALMCLERRVTDVTRGCLPFVLFSEAIYNSEIVTSGWRPWRKNVCCYYVSITWSTELVAVMVSNKQFWNSFQEVWKLWRTKHGVLRWCYTGRLATPTCNACFSHEFADMLHFWIAFKNFQRVTALQISQKIVRNGVLH